ncbi:hypothetical protein ISN45_Aa08g011310 [Arabidopsis thaliana x Arabidopsis arenosa]|uniref:DUF4283 domain-containing protein n=1 Tax=Arabidopsis thaliana x Arabidopsis arenosa TaxID=1240361 RepID=A0A8T1XMM5_9BRAS|nr:hypothetical protein ISN45_Aa08g011310 [Arabidopsis thaliana x Arabidopsis arenosa]
MSSAMDKALMAMSLEEEEEILFDMPNLPEFMSMERNVLSLVGRTLNPSCQSMKNLIRDMPRKWQKPGRMRGFALSSERFQFIFFNEHDLQEVLDKGSHTYNDWSLAVDRWYEVPPPNYLQIIPFWVQIWNMPINFYIVPAITTLGELIGEVKVVAFDPNRPHYLEFVCVKVLFDVSRPLHRSKVVNLPQGGTITVRFQYERVQKRCYECQRITHEKNYCPILIKRREDLVAARRSGNPIPKPPKAIFLKESDPLYGILREDQYMVVNNNEDWQIKAYRVRKSVSEVEKDPITKKMVMQLESPPVVQLQANKGKGVIFDYIDSDPGSMPKATVSSSQLLHPSALTSSVERNWLMDSESLKASEDPGKCFSTIESAQKVREDWLEWMEAQKIEAEEESGLGNGLSGLGGSERSMAVGWIAPPINWLKCNVATSWSKKNKFDGCAWVLRDHVGKVLLHSRCALTGSLVKQEAQFKGLLWGIERMWFHRVEKVVFALQEEFLVNAVSRPAAWPSFRYQSMVLVQVLSSFRSWKILLENSSSNRGTFLIAKSVTDDCRLQSYVVVCHPAWVDGVFNEERISSSD